MSALWLLLLGSLLIINNCDARAVSTHFFFFIILGTKLFMVIKCTNSLLQHVLQNLSFFLNEIFFFVNILFFMCFIFFFAMSLDDFDINSSYRAFFVKYELKNTFT